MKEIVVDLDHIKKVSSDNGAFFSEFKSRVKKIPIKEFDQLALPIINEVTSGIDCTQCGNCCKIQEPGVTEEEITVLANISKMDVPEFKNKFVAYDHQRVSFLCKQPCIFLHKTSCSIYPDRPNSCADFPGLHRPGLKWRLHQMEENYGICPIVYNVVERLNSIISA